MQTAELGAPTYVITGWFADRPERPGSDDRYTAEHIESIRLAVPTDAAEVAQRVADSDEAIRTLALGPAHRHPDDVSLAVDVDRFAFAMEVTRGEFGLRLDRVDPA